MKKKLPIGIQNIKELIEGGYVYIDKTKYIYELMSNGKYYFLSRPRRFGKSLLVSTLEEIFKGNKELFKDLYIYDKVKFETHPIIKIDFNNIEYLKGEEEFENSLSKLMNKIGNEYNITLEMKTPKDKFNELIYKLSKINRVIILIDEYDKPILGHITDVKKANKNREILSNFYEVIKGNDEYIKFCILTGVSKFSKTSIFSKLNNLQDLTLNEEYNSLLGYTQEELEKYFKENIEEVSQKYKIERAKLLEGIKDWYNGYNFGGKETLYNPFSILSFFADKKFNNYWFSTGTPNFLINLIKKQKLNIAELETMLTGKETFESFEVETLEVLPILYQTGYITIKEIKNELYEDEYKLGFPNNEVRNAFLNHLLVSFIEKEVSKVGPLNKKLVRALKADDIETFISVLTGMLSGIPSKLHLKHEYYYQSIFYMIMTLMGMKLNLEDLTDKGQIDGVLEFEDKLYIIEFKMDSARKAMDQILEKKYYEKYVNSGKKINLLGIGGFKNKKLEYFKM
ncbi:MAG: AAA family ATPase [bacterium]